MTTTTTKSSSSSSEGDPLRDAVIEEFTEAGYTEEEIQAVLAKQDALRRRKDNDADHAYHLPWDYDEADRENIVIMKGISKELLNEIFDHSRRAREDNNKIRSSNPSGGKYGLASARMNPQANYYATADYVQQASYFKPSSMQRPGAAVYDDPYEYDYVRISRPRRSAPREDWIYTE
ncbi:hypothetical protein BDV11DRAFT_209990 [Aspergillus similis]